MQYVHEGDSVSLAGFYDDADNTIYISKGLTKAEAECVYFHEWQHRKCYLEGCFCYNQLSNYWAERHAYLYELKTVIARGSRSLTKAYFRGIASCLIKFEEHPKVWADNSRALKQVIQTKIYREFERESRRQTA